MLITASFIKLDFNFRRSQSQERRKVSEVNVKDGHDKASSYFSRHDGVVPEH